MSHDGGTMVTANVFTNDSSIYDFPSNRAAVVPTGSHAIATGMMPDSSKMGGQGVLAIPVPYNGWVQRLPENWKQLLTPQQRNPAP